MLTFLNPPRSIDYPEENRRLSDMSGLSPDVQKEQRNLRTMIRLSRLNDAQFKIFCEMIPKYEQMEGFELSRADFSGLSTDKINALGAALGHCTRLRSITLAGVQASPHQIEALGVALQCCEGIENIYIRDHILRYSPEQIEAFGSFLAHERMQSLNLLRQYLRAFSSDKIRALGAMFARSEHLRSVDFQMSFSTTPVGTQFGAALRQCKGLKRLGIEIVRLVTESDDATAPEKIVEELGAICRQDNLQEIKFAIQSNDMPFNEEQMQAFGVGLRQCLGLRKLELDPNDGMGLCRLEAVRTFVGAVSESQSLTQVNTRKDIPPHIREWLASLHGIELDLNTKLYSEDIPHECKAVLLDTCRRNHDRLVKQILAASEAMITREDYVAKPVRRAALCFSFPRADMRLIDRVDASASKVIYDRLDRGDYAQIHRAALVNDVVEIDALLKREASVDRETAINQGTVRYTALHIAAAQGHVEAVRILLAAGADPTQKSHDGNGEKTPLEFASEALARAEGEGNPAKKAAFTSIIEQLGGVVRSRVRPAASG